MQNTALQSPKISAKHALRDAVMALQQARIETAALDARLLLLHVLGINHEAWVAENDWPMTSAQFAQFQALTQERAAYRPVAQILGRREFFGRAFKVTEATLDPRPDSETLIEAALEWAKGHTKPMTILDLGTGTGCLLLTLLMECENAHGIGVDISEAALIVARENAKNLGCARADFVQSHWGENVKGSFDIIIANPPYIPGDAIAMLAPEVAQYEPKLALDGGADGLNCYRTIMQQLPQLLAKKGIALFEIGQGQEEDVRKIVASCQLLVAGSKQDLQGITRCLLVTGNGQRTTGNA